jgi:hypothetical protein
MAVDDADHLAGAARPQRGQVTMDADPAQPHRSYAKGGQPGERLCKTAESK